VSLFTLLPVVAFAGGALAIGLAVARVLDEVQQLRMELERVRRARPLMAEVGTETLRMRLALARLRRR
jgi:hypothetical protein